MKVFQLILVLYLLLSFTYSKSSSTILKCTINSAPDWAVNAFMNSFNQSPGSAYNLLNSKRSSLTKYINKCK